MSIKVITYFLQSSFRLKPTFFVILINVFLPFTVAYSAEQFDWSRFESLLKTHVKPGSYQGVNANVVDYQALLNEVDFLSIDQKLTTYNPSNLQRDEKLAFYINAYNYYAVKIVLDNWPVEGIKDIGSLIRPVWKKTVGKINNRAVSLNEIEHEILRPMGEPRIHFAIVCSSMSCPDLRMEVFTAEIINEQLDSQTDLFLANKTKGAVVQNGELYLSKIFDWFEDDFDSDGGVFKFVERYRKNLSGFEDFDTLDYNWKLNQIRSRIKN